MFAQMKENVCISYAVFIDLWVEQFGTAGEHACLGFEGQAKIVTLSSTATVCVHSSVCLCQACIQNWSFQGLWSSVLRTKVSNWLSTGDQKHIVVLIHSG